MDLRRGRGELGGGYRISERGGVEIQATVKY